MRRFFTGLLILISAVCLFGSSVSLWTRHNVINTQVFVSNVETMVDLPQVEARINQKVTDTVMTNPDVQDAINNAMAVLPPRLQQFRPTVENGIRSLISAGVQRLLTNDPFRPLTSGALTSAHQQLVNGQPVRFTLGQAKARIPASAKSGLAGQVLDLLPNDVGFTVVTPADAPQLYNAIDLLKSLWLWLGLAFLATLAGALGISRRRRSTLRAWSVTTTVLLLLELIALRVAAGRIVVAAKPENRDAVRAMYDVVAQSLRSWTLWLVGFALLVLVVTLLWGRIGIIPGIRRGWASARERIQQRREAHAAAQAAAAEALAGGAEPGAVPVAPVQESWPRRVAANTQAFAEGLELDRRVAALGGFVQKHHKPAQWTGIVVGALVLLFWPSPTLSVLIWIGAFVALYLGALVWLENRGPAEAPGAGGPAAGAVVAAAGPVAAVATAESAGGTTGASVPSARPPSDGARGSTLVAARPEVAPPEPVSGEALTNLSDRVDLLIRLGSARDSGLLTDEEFSREKTRLLVG